MLTLANVSSGYGFATIVCDVSLSVEKGEVLAILGKNGMGKSTLLKTIMGYNRAEAGGKISFDGREIVGAATHSIARLGATFAPQERALFHDLAVQDNLRLGARSDREFSEKLPKILDLFPFLRSRMPQKAGTLSGGEQKMLVMARILLAQHKLIMIDEITEGLQPAIIERVSRVFYDISNFGDAAVIIVEQNVDFALRVANRYCVMKHGSIVESGAVSDPGGRTRIDRHLTL
jgi:ABC-type branched-subunit amino acid transport system ATPase component